jgi:hypothetical protein
MEKAFEFQPNVGTKMKQNDRVIILEPKVGGAKNTAGMVDNRLFTGENKLHAKMDPTNCQWYLQYDSGLVTDALKGRWTSFSKLKETVEQYFNKRNVKIKAILD